MSARVSAELLKELMSLKKSIKIISPSYKRAGSARIFSLFGTSIVFAVHKFEEKGYRDKYPEDELMILPDKLRGKDNCNSDYLVMIDDDVKGIGYCEFKEGNSADQIMMSADQAYKFFLNGFSMAEELGTVLWGVNLQSDPKFYRNYSPISLLSPVLGTFSCHIVKGNDIRYDERLGLNEDYDFFIQVMHRYHKVLRFNKFFYMAGHLKDKGGCGAYRTMKEEERQSKIMIKKWGSNVIKYDLKKSTNPRIYIPLKGI
jgi:hypothetical protein